MMYIETISNNEDTFRIERQRDTPDGAWYGLWLYLSDINGKERNLSDNDEYIIGELFYSLRDNPKRGMEEIGLEYNKDHAKILVKLIKKAYKLGWFEHLKEKTA
jgi:hypothetical protein